MTRGRPGQPSLLKGRTYEEIYGVEKAVKLRSQKKWLVPGQPGPCTEQRRQAISKALKGRVLSDEYRARISTSKRGKSSMTKERYKEISKRHNDLDLPNCRCYVHGAARPYMISSLTWKLADVLVAAGFNKVIAEAQFGRKRVDVLLADEWLAFEADGNYHFTDDRQAYDKQRDEDLLNRFDLPVVRLSGSEVEKLYNGI